MTILRAPNWSGYATAAWGAGYATLALWWTVAGHGYPYGWQNRGDLTAMNNLPPQVGAPLLAGVGLAVAVLAVVMTGRRALRLHSRPRLFVLGLGWTLAGLLVAVVPGAGLLALTGYAPLLILGAPFGVLEDVDFGQVFGAPMQNETASLLGGVLLAATVLAYQRRTATPGRTSVVRPVVLGRWSVAVAVLIPLLYALTRLAWLVDVPLGISAAELRDLRSTGAVWSGAALAAAAMGGALLTLGLVQRWGETFPRWIPWLRGRRVPIRLATIPAGYVALVVLAAGVGVLGSPIMFDAIKNSFWAFAPMLLWPVWAVALGTAAYAYHRRRITRNG
jgi:hypothetical protein